jgi:hypothetical protein
MEPGSHQPIAAGTALVHVSNAFFELLDYNGDDSILADASAPNGLVALGSSGGIVVTGQQDGPVEVTVELLPQEPPVTVDGWDDVVEVTQHTDSGQVSVSVTITGDNAPTLPPYRGQPDSWFGLRVHARGRDIGGQYVVAPPNLVEHYLLQMWPVAGPAAEVIHRKSR